MKRVVALMAICCWWCARRCAAAADFPAKGKSITMILGTSAGGSTDVGARILATALEKELAATGNRIQVENKPGAGWQIGLDGARALSARTGTRSASPSFRRRSPTTWTRSERPSSIGSPSSRSGCRWWIRA